MKVSQLRLTKKKQLFDGLKLLLFSALLLIFPNPVKALTIVNSWQPIFQGIDYATGFTDDPVPQQVNSLRIDLFNPTVHFFSTPSNGIEPLETTAQTTSQFLDQYDLQVAVNANFFAPCCVVATEPKDLIGLAISGGNIVSPSDAQISGNIGEVPNSLLLTQNNQAQIVLTNPSDDFSNIFTAVSAGPRLLTDGAIVVPQIPPDSFYDLNPRTAVGISENEQYLILMTIDGRQPGISEGATLYQTAQWLQRFGSYQGLNLDGGGSTTMVREGLQGMPQILNTPSGSGIERFNGNNFGVFAQAIPVPEPGSLLFIFTFGVYLVTRRPVQH
jgi:hypothetical protein